MNKHMNSKLNQLKIIFIASKKYFSLFSPNWNRTWLLLVRKPTLKPIATKLIKTRLEQISFKIRRRSRPANQEWST